MKRIEESGIYSVSFRNALAKAKRDADKEKYSFYENIENVMYEYYLNEEEVKALTEKLKEYCCKNYLYRRDLGSEWN